jgi:hypothetical protein
MMMDELSALPIAFAWLKQSLGWWNRICIRPDTDIVRWACLDNVQLGVNGNKSWAYHMSTTLGHLCNTNQASFLQGNVVQTSSVMTVLQSKWQQHQYSTCSRFENTSVHEVPASQSIGFKTYTYTRWFRPISPTHHNYVQYINNPVNIRAIASFRMGAHKLSINDHSINRDDRICRVCASHDRHVREDEMHILCCPGYLDLRHEFQDVVPDLNDNISDSAMHKIMNKGNDSAAWNRLALFIRRVYEVRTRLMADIV